MVTYKLLDVQGAIQLANRGQGVRYEAHGELPAGDADAMRREIIDEPSAAYALRARPYCE